MALRAELLFNSSAVFSAGRRSMARITSSRKRLHDLQPSPLVERSKANI
jgi:hypothetical protein